MKLIFCLSAVLLLHRASSNEQPWSWGAGSNEPAAQAPEDAEPSGRFAPSYQEDLQAAPSEQVNATAAGLIIDEIISSTREGRAIDGFDEVYSDPSVQEALQNGDDGEARNLIKDRLCAIGLMQCDDVEGKRPYISPEQLIYAQPVAINPVGKPIPTIPVKGVRGIGGYGPPKPLPYPATRPLPPAKYPPHQNKYPSSGNPSYFHQGKPPRRYFGVPPSKPVYGKPLNPNGEVYEGPEFYDKPPSFLAGANQFVEPIEPETPYKFYQNAPPFGHKDKRVEITVNAQGGTTVTPASVEHVHHHYHHNLEGGNKPLVINPIPVASAAATTTDLSGPFQSHQGNFGNFGTFKPSASVATTAGLGNYQSGTYGGQTIANYGPKPVEENYNYNSFGASVGSFGSSGLYKKELNLNSGNNNYLQSGYADKYQGLESSNFDCTCVPYNQCPSQDVIGRKDDLYLPLDPRNLKTQIEALTDEEANSTLTTANTTDSTDIKTVSKRETSSVDASVKEDAKPEARQRQYGSLGNVDMKKIKPTIGISFGLPQQGGGGYPANPYGPSPFPNPYGNALGASGINLGLVSVNPLVSIQLSKDDYGNKEIKPFVNLHVTPNNFLIHKFEDLFSYKKAVIFNKHKHFHVHKGHQQYHPHGVYHPHEYPPHEYPSHEYHPHGYHPHEYHPHEVYHPHEEYHPHDVYREHPYEFAHHQRPHPDYHRPEGPPPFEHHPYFDNPLNYGGGEYVNSFGRTYRNDSNSVVEGSSVLRQYQNLQSYPPSDFNFNTRSFRAGKSLQSAPSNPVKFPTSRKRRDLQGIVDEEPSERQFYGGQSQACGPRHVCCKRPLRPQIPNLSNRQCGTRHSQGVNGRIKNPVYVDGDSEFGEYPWQVAILKKDAKESVYVCGGTLIDSLHILTAAHCVKTYGGFDLRARLGEWDVNHDVEFYPYVERDVVSVHVHPEFYAGTLYNDIAVLRMDAPVDWSKYPHISPACLPRPHDEYAGTRCWTTGWGKDAFGDFGKYQNVLKEVDVPVVGNEVCQRILQNTRLGYDFKLHPGFVCAGGEEGKDACKGDGGGPMVCERGGTWQVVGLVSWGIGCGQNGVPGVYVKVSHYLDWIKQITQRF